MISKNAARVSLSSRLTVLTFILSLTFLAACSNEDASIREEAEPTREALATQATKTISVPDSWEPFQFGAVNGFIPSEWEAYVLTPEEAKELAQTGLNLIENADVQSATEDFTWDGLKENVLVLTTPDGNPYINISFCADFGAEVDSSRSERIKRGIESGFGVDVEIVDDVVIEGTPYGMFRIQWSEGLETVQVLYGSADCGNTATLASDSIALEDLENFKTVLSLLTVVR